MTEKANYYWGRMNALESECEKHLMPIAFRVLKLMNAEAFETYRDKGELWPLVAAVESMNKILDKAASNGSK